MTSPKGSKGNKDAPSAEEFKKVQDQLRATQLDLAKLQGKYKAALSNSGASHSKPEKAPKEPKAAPAPAAAAAKAAPAPAPSADAGKVLALEATLREREEHYGALNANLHGQILFLQEELREAEANKNRRIQLESKVNELQRKLEQAKSAKAGKPKSATKVAEWREEDESEEEEEAAVSRLRILSSGGLRCG